MIDREYEKLKDDGSASSQRLEPAEHLPYRIEIWHASARAVERVLARATNMALARAIFKAAQAENSGRRVTLNKGSKIILDSANRKATQNIL